MQGSRKTPTARRRAGAGRRDDGFTLLEIIVVVAILGLVARVVFVNMEGMIPTSTLDAERNVLAAEFDQLRSEAAINSKSYAVELDITNDRWRVILPPELKVASDQIVDDTREGNAMGWTAIHEDVDLVGVGAVGRPILRNGLTDVVFNENGECADYVLYLRHRSDENLVWTMVYRGLAGEVEYVDNTDGVEHRVDVVTEGAF